MKSYDSAITSQVYLLAATERKNMENYAVLTMRAFITKTFHTHQKVYIYLTLCMIL